MLNIHCYANITTISLSDRIITSRVKFYKLQVVDIHIIASYIVT